MLLDLWGKVANLLHAFQQTLAIHVFNKTQPSLTDSPKTYHKNSLLTHLYMLEQLRGILGGYAWVKKSRGRTGF